MKIIFSRKGFDSGYGGIPSPIFEDGTFVSLPIPSKFGRPISELRFRNQTLSELVNELKDGHILPTQSVHLDPDLSENAAPRMAGWNPAFGQAGGAQGHLRNEGVEVGDIFLFFGWYQRVEKRDGRLRYVGTQIHSLFGWLQIADILSVSDAGAVLQRFPWLADHPHIRYATSIGANNTVYIGARRLCVGNTVTEFPGAGVFPRWMPKLQLTEPSQSRSIWNLPGWMLPSNGRPVLSYHTNPIKWERILANKVRLRSAAKGQEFVLNHPNTLAVEQWIIDLFRETVGGINA